MKNYIWLTVFILISLKTIAQSEKESTDSTNFKNEVSVNVVPVISEILVGDVEHRKYSFAYKHLIKDNLFLRLQIHYIPNFSYNYENEQLNYYEIEKINDTITQVYSRNIDSYCYGASIGLEWEKERKTLYRFMGFNLEYNINDLSYSFISDTYNYKNGELAGTETVEAEFNSQINKISLDLFYGWKIKLEDQFLLLVQFGPDIGYYFGDLVYLNEDKELDNRSFTDLNMTKYFMNELSLAFRF